MVKYRILYLDEKKCRNGCSIGTCHIVSKRTPSAHRLIDKTTNQIILIIIALNPAVCKSKQKPT